MDENETPLLRADATDDDLQAEEGGTVEQPAPKQQVPVVIGGVFHGMREED